MDRMLCFKGPCETLEEFERLCAYAAAHGGTHVGISTLPKAMWKLRRDPTDPYPTWNIPHATFFNIFTPDALKPYYDQDYSRRVQEILAERGRIMKKYGLRGIFNGNEPSYVDNALWAVHPEWRGPRCEKPRLAKKGYYALCVDHPEVLAMYRESVRKLCELLPIDSFSFLSNDSGAGVCWTDSLYPGVNGNPACRHINKGERFAHFMSTIQAGAMDAGMPLPFVAMGGSIEPQEALGILPYLKERQTICGRTNDRDVISGQMGMAIPYFESAFYPARNIPELMPFIQGYGSAASRGANRITVALSGLSEGEDVTARLYEKCLASAPAVTRKQAEDLLYDFCRDEVGDALCDDLYEMHIGIEKAKERLAAIVTGPILLISTVGDRWLTRPLVADELSLPDEDRRYFRDYQFHALSEENAADLACVHTWRFFGGNGATFITSNLFKVAISHIQTARAKAQRIAAEVGDPVRAKEFRVLAQRLSVVLCIYRNAINCISFQDTLDRIDRTLPPTENPVKYEHGDQKWHELHLIIHDELYNTGELIRLLKEAEAPLLLTASTPEEEDPLWLAPDILPHLEKKLDIMLRHMEDINPLLRRDS